MRKNGNDLGEIVIVGSRYGKLADVITPLYSQEGPIEQKDIRKALGNDVVYLSPVSGLIDKLAVGVHTEDNRRLGYVWMCQSHNIHFWMKENNQEYLGVRIKEVNRVANVMIAETLNPIQLPKMQRCSLEIDMNWAKNLPMKLPCYKIDSLHLAIFLLNQVLDDAKEWSEMLQRKIENVLVALPLELSAYSNESCMELYYRMKASEIKEVRQQADYMLRTLVHRGSKEHIKWWLDSWLPDLFRDAEESDLLRMFEAANYTLSGVEEMLHDAPGHLFHLYQVNRLDFAFSLYYASLPEEQYIRLMTLLAVRELMLKKGKKINDDNLTSTLTDEVLARAIEYVQPYFWGYSSNAVVFCVCRDKYSHADNASLFERETRELEYHKTIKYLCKDGTIANAFNRNPYLKFHIDKWESMGAKGRALILRDEFIKAVEKVKTEIKQL